MTVLQITLMFLAGLAAAYQIMKFSMLVGIISYQGSVTIRNSFLASLVVTVGVQCAFVVSLTGVN